MSRGDGESPARRGRCLARSSLLSRRSPLRRARRPGRRPRRTNRRSRSAAASSTSRGGRRARPRAGRRRARSWSRREAGEPSARRTTDAEGAYLVGLAEPGTYVVASTRNRCPRASRSRRARTRATVVIRPNGQQTRAFFLGESGRDDREPAGTGCPQTLANGLKLAMIIAITVDRPVADLRHDRAVELRPRRDGDVRGARSRSCFNTSVGWHIIAGRDRRIVALGAARMPLRARDLATAAPPQDEPDVDDDRVDRPRARRALRVPVLVRRPTSRRTGSTRCSPTGRHRPDRLHAAVAVGDRAVVGDHRRPWRCSCSGPASARRSAPCRTTPTWRRRPASTPTA